jgi:hypothetical protein
MYHPLVSPFGMWNCCAMETTASTAAKPTSNPGRHSFAPGNNVNPLGRAARAKREAAERAAEVAALTADLGRAPTAAERLLIAEAAAVAVEGRRLRRLGKGSADASRLLSRILKQLDFGKPLEPPRETLAEIAAQAQAEEDERRALALAADAAAAAAGEYDRPAADERTGEPAEPAVSVEDEI